MELFIKLLPFNLIIIPVFICISIFEVEEFKMQLLFRFWINLDGEDEK